MPTPPPFEPRVGYPAYREQWIADNLSDADVPPRRALAVALYGHWNDEAELDPPTTRLGDPDRPGGVGLVVFDLATDPDGADAVTLVVADVEPPTADEDLERGHVIAKFLAGRRADLPCLDAATAERVLKFVRNCRDGDRLTLLVGSVDALDPDRTAAWEATFEEARRTVGPCVIWERVSVESIHHGLGERSDIASLVGDDRPGVLLRAELLPAKSGLRVGPVSLRAMYDFLHAYRATTGDLDRLYDRNVRRFLGGRNKVNSAIVRTLRESPEHFGLFNNGITIVASTVREEDGALSLAEPAVVNGCQTTRALWEVLHERLPAEGKKPSPQFESWVRRLEDGALVVKIVSLEETEEELLPEITRFTNSQNKVQDKDFIALEEDFRRWMREFEEVRGLYLEIQRGGWVSRQALQSEPGYAGRRLTESANAAELVKIVAAGWGRQPGRAFSENKSFVPGGVEYKRITDREGFGADDLYAAVLLEREKSRLGFSTGSGKPGRSQTKFLFYCVAVELVRHVVAQAGGAAEDDAALTRAVLALGKADLLATLADSAASVLDDYMTRGGGDDIYEEPLFTEKNSDLNAFLKSGELQPGGAKTPHFATQVKLGRKDLARSGIEKMKAAILA